MDVLEAVTDLLYGPGGVTMLGHEMDDAVAVERTQERFPGKTFCLVRQWIWIDLEMPDAVREELERSGKQPVMLYAHHVVFDSVGRARAGDWIRSTPLVSFTEGCFFQSANTVYVLLGCGVRKSAMLSTVVRIF